MTNESELNELDSLIAKYSPDKYNYYTTNPCDKSNLFDMIQDIPKSELNAFVKKHKEGIKL